jgi:hypothetical protein
MRIAVLAASGGTGHQLAAQALDRGHSVLALARDPRKVDLPGSADLAVVTADVLHGETAGLLTDVDAVVSGIGIRKGDPAGTLVAGARALAAAAPARLVWLGKPGTSHGRPCRVQSPGPDARPGDPGYRRRRHARRSGEIPAPRRDRGPAALNATAEDSPTPGAARADPGPPARHHHPVQASNEQKPNKRSIP